MVSKTAEKREEELSEKEILAGVPALKPASAFRQRDKSNLTKLAVRLRGFTNEDGEVNTDDDDALEALLDFLADADDFFEAIAADRETYVSWSTGLKDSEQVLSTLVGKYQRELGE